MKKNIIMLAFLFAFNSYSQIIEFNTNDLKKVIELTQFKGVGRLKGYAPQKINQFLNAVEANEPVLKQLNIDSWFYCEYKKIDNLETYNYYYKDITRNTYDLYCKEINTLMLMDDILQHPK